MRDRIVASVHSVRENLRFKPYVRYEYFHRDNPDVQSHEAWIGAHGPVTDLLYFRGELGMHWRPDQGTQDLVWRGWLSKDVHHAALPGEFMSLQF